MCAHGCAYACEYACASYLAPRAASGVVMCACACRHMRVYLIAESIEIVPPLRKDAVIEPLRAQLLAPVCGLGLWTAVHMCADTCVGVYLGIYIDVCIDMCVNMCMHMCPRMSAGMCAKAASLLYSGSWWAASHKLLTTIHCPLPTSHQPPATRR